MAGEDINLIRYLNIVKKRKFLVLLVAALAVIVTLITIQFSPKEYKTIAVIQLSNPDIRLIEEEIQVTSQQPQPKHTASYLIEVSTGDDILKETISQAKLKLNVAELRRKIESGSSEAGDAITLLVTDSKPKRAALIANSLAKNLVRLARKLDARKRRFLQVSLNDVKRRLAQIEEQRKIGEETISQAKIDATLGSSERILVKAQALQALSTFTSLQKELSQEKRELEAKLLEMGESKVSKLADIPLKPSGRSLGLNLALALVLGLVAGVGLAILAESWAP